MNTFPNPNADLQSAETTPTQGTPEPESATAQPHINDVSQTSDLDNTDGLYNLDTIEDVLASDDTLPPEWEVRPDGANPELPVHIMIAPRPHPVELDPHIKRADEDPTPRRYDGMPFTPQTIQDDYDIPNSFLSSPAEVMPDVEVWRQICPEIGTPEYEARPQRIKDALARSKRLQPELKPLTTLEDFEDFAALVYRYYVWNPELYQLVKDFEFFCSPNSRHDIMRYFEPHQRAGNFIRPDVSDEDPATTDHYIQRARKKAADGVNRMLYRAVNRSEEVSESRVRTLLALATAVKYIKQADPNSPRSVGRPLAENGHTVQRSNAAPLGRGGKRDGAGRKKKLRPEDESRTQPENSATQSQETEINVKIPINKPNKISTH